MITTVEREFHRLAASPEPSIDLIEGALLVAKDEYPDLDLAACRARIDALADAAGPVIEAAGSNPFAVIDAINTYLFRDLGFRANQDDYFDPRNSYINDVLDTRRGIPITLSILYMAVAARAGFPVVGVGFPGHFLVRYVGEDREILIDPYHGGTVLMPEDCRRLLRATFRRDVPVDPRFLQAVSTRQVLARMLNNLKHIYMKREDHDRALRVIDRLVSLCPDDAHHVRDRGIVHFRLANLESATTDLERYVALRPDATDAEKCRRRIRSIRRLTAMLN